MQNCIAINIYRVFSYKILYQNAPCKSIAERVNNDLDFSLLGLTTRYKVLIRQRSLTCLPCVKGGA